MINVEDILNPYILEYRNEFSEYNISEFKNMVDNLNKKVNGKIVAFKIAKKINPDIYIKYLKKALSNIDNMDVDVTSLDNFFSDTYNSLPLDNVNLTMTFRSDDEIKHIKPNYLKSVYNDTMNTIAKIGSNSISKKDLYTKYLLNDVYLNKMKKRLVDTTYTMNDIRDLMIMDSPSVTNIDSTFIQHNIIPFIRSYVPNITELRSQIVHTIGQINNLSYDMNMLIDRLCGEINNNKLSQSQIHLIKYFMFNINTIVMKLSSYITAMLLIKSSCILFNAKSCLELYNTIRGYFPEMESILHENVMDGNVTDIDNTRLLNSIINTDLSIVIPHIQKAVGIKKMEIANDVAKRYNMSIRYDSDIDTTKYPYDGRPYATINASISDIMKNLSKFYEECEKNDSSIDDIVNATHLNETFSLRYTKVLNNIENVSYYTSQITDLDSNPDVFLSLFNDISNFERNIYIISKNMKKAYDLIDSLIKKYDHNLIGSDEIFTNDVRSFIETLMSNYKEYIIHVTRSLLNRLDSLTSLLNDDCDDISDYSTASSWDKMNDYTLDAYKEAYDDIVENEKRIINELMWEHKRLTSIIERGVDLIKEETTTISTDKSDSSPKVEGVPKQADNNTDKQTSQNQGTKKSTLERFREFINNMIDKFTKKTTELTVKNDKWLNNVKSKLMNIDTENIKITVAKYEGLDDSRLNSDITSSINKINAINISNPPNEMIKSKESCEFYLFPSIPEKVGDESSFAGRIKRFYTYGTADKTELISYSGSDAKAKIDEMIKFCEEYKRSSQNLTNNIKKLSDAAIKKETEMMNASANKNNTNDNSEKSHKIENSISSATREYCGAVPTVMEKKYLDYYKVLYALAGNGDTNKKDNEPTTEEEK